MYDLLEVYTLFSRSPEGTIEKKQNAITGSALISCRQKGCNLHEFQYNRSRFSYFPVNLSLAWVSCSLVVLVTG